MSDATPTAPNVPMRRHRPRVRLRTLVLLVAVIAAALGIWRSWNQDGDPQRAWISHQLRALEGADPSGRRAAAEVLGTAGVAKDRRIAPALVAALADDPDATVRSHAAFALGSVLPGGSEPRDGSTAAEVRTATGVLIAALADRDARVRSSAITTLGHLHFGASNPIGGSAGLDPSPVIRALGRTAHDPDPNVLSEAVRWIGWLAPEGGDAPIVLLDALDDPIEWVRIGALEAIRLRAPYWGWRNADEIARRIVRGLGSARGAEVSHLLSTLDLLGVDPLEEALPMLLRFLEDDEVLGWARPNLAHILGRYGGLARPALPGLSRLAEEEINPGRYPLPAVEAIFRIAPDSPEAQAMAEAMAKLHRDTKHEFIARDVALMLAGLGPSAQAALPILRQTALTGRDPTHREQASLAIEAIEATGK